MNTKTTKQKFISLRAAGLTYKAIAETLDISVSTALRWNKSLEDEISKIKNRNVNALAEFLNPRVDKYIQFFEKNFDILQKELSKHNEFIMPYDKVIRNSVRVMNVLSKLISLKRSLAFSVNPDDLPCDDVESEEQTDEQNEYMNEDAESNIND